MIHLTVRKGRLFSCLLLTASVLYSGETLLAQGPSPISEGREFWVAFQKNFRDYETDDASRELAPGPPLELSLVIVSRNNATVTIETPGDIRVLRLTAGETRIVEIDSSLQITRSEEVQSSSVHVTSDQPISIVAISHRYQTTDSYTVFPVEGLGTLYRAVGYKWLADDLLSQFAVVATENGTTIEIIPSSKTSSGIPAGRPIHVELDRGEVYQVRPGFNPSQPSDLTGTSIEASRPVAVFSGHNCAYVPEQRYKACNILCEQLSPVELWGKTFVVPPLLPRSGYTIRIIPETEGTKVRINGSHDVVISGLWYEASMPAKVTVIEADSPVQVVQYGHGYTAPATGTGRVDSLGDPTMIMIPPTVSYGLEYVASAPFEKDYQNYIGVVTSEAGRAGIVIGGQRVDPSIFQRVGESDYWFACIEVLGGTRRVVCSHSTGITSYGFGFGERIYDSYGHTAPMTRFEPIMNNPTVEDLSEEEESDPSLEELQETPAIELREGSTWRPVERIEVRRD